MSKSLADQFLSIMNNLDAGVTVSRVEELYNDIKETEARANTSIQPPDRIDKILSSFILVLTWISGYLFASGLLLSWPQNPLWPLPSLTTLGAALAISLIMSNSRRNKA